MTIEEVLNRDTKFQYMLLSRLQSDCYSAGPMWASSPDEQIKYMVAIWANLKVKPEWLTRKELNQLSIKLTGKELKAEK